MKLVLLLSLARYTVLASPGFGGSDHDYTPMKLGESFELEYQVIDGGDLDITFQLIDPKGRLVASDVRKEDGVHSVDNPVAGDYQFCFDNTFSRMTEKVVFFEIYRDEDYDYYEDDDWKSNLKQDSDILEDRMSEIQLALSRMKMNMVKTGQIQNLLRAFEAKDRNLIEANQQRVDSWSMIHLSVMVSTAVLQMYLLRSMFKHTGNNSPKSRT